MKRVTAKTLLIVGVVTGGCVSPPPPREPVTGVTSSRIDPLVVPADFSVDLTVWAETPDSARFMVFCDGSLHWSGGVERPADGVPPLRRVLRRGDMAALWTLIRQLGMDDAAQATPPVNVHLLEPPAGQVQYLAVVTGDGDRWAFLRRVPAGEQDAAMTSLAGRLAELAWADDTGAAPRVPRRRDFGPDPYARYRR